MTPVLATRILHDDHKRLTGLFRQLESVDLKAHEMREGVVREIIMELEIHSSVEEQIFYPALLAALADESKTARSKRAVPPACFIDTAHVDQSIRDHREIQGAIQKLRRLPANGTEFHDQFNELIELVGSHFEEEEKITFPAAETLLADDLSPLGAQIQDMRDDLLSQPQYETARPGVVRIPTAENR